MTSWNRFKQSYSVHWQSVNPLLHLPDCDLSVKFATAAEDVPILGGAERRHLVVVAVKLLQHLVALCVQDVNLAFGRAAAHAAHPHLERKRGILKRDGECGVDFGL